ncbi:MAG TPA: DUF488 domain-containing protein [Gemmatimonadales bacterium]|jgi:uncharacterized protein (DUF488 family)
MSLTVWTVGHSTRPLPDFLEVLAAYQIELVADVRRFPGSRSQPQYQQLVLEPALQEAGVGYIWLPQLGGRRRPLPNSQNTGWRHPAFRGYADHMLGEEFAVGLSELLTLAWGLRTAVMCAEILWWRCHRRMIADVLVSLGAQVIHIRDGKIAESHRLRTPGHMVGGVLSYLPEG